MKNRLLCSIHEAVERSIEGVRSRGEYGVRQLRLVVAVSGGVDSVSLLHALFSLRDKGGIELFVAHLDHGLRPESSGEVEVVRRLAEQYGLSFLTERAPFMPRGVNLEAWAREVRYNFLERSRQHFRGDLVVTAHHQNDQAETLLLRLLSGRLASEGYAITPFDSSRNLLRPLLRVSRQNIEQYAQEHSLTFVTDGSNFDLSRTRNRIRHELLPELAQSYNPGIVGSLSEFGARLADDEELLWRQAREVVQELSLAESLATLSALPPALQWRVLRLLCERSIGEQARKLGYRALKRFLQENPHPGRGGVQRSFDLGFGIRCAVGPKGELLFSLNHERSVGKEALPGEVLEIPGKVVRRYGERCEVEVEASFFERRGGEPFCGKKVRSSREAKACPELSGENGGGVLGESEKGGGMIESVALFDGALFGQSSLFVRERRAGDSMRVWRRGSRKLKKLFQEQGVKPEVRETTPVVEFLGEVIWVPGIARSQMAPVTEETTVVLELRSIRCDTRRGSTQMIHCC